MLAAVVGSNMVEPIVPNSIAAHMACPLRSIVPANSLCGGSLATFDP